MSSVAEQNSRPLVYGLRIGVWYATLFVAGSMAIVSLTYLLASASLAQRDRQMIDSKLGAYATAYDRGGIDGLAATVQTKTPPPCEPCQRTICTMNDHACMRTIAAADVVAIAEQVLADAGARAAH